MSVVRPSRATPQTAGRIGPAREAGTAACLIAEREESGLDRSGNCAILLVDDHDLVRAAIADVLVSLGFEVVEAESGEAAAERLAGGLHIDLLITDYLMPGMSGIELARLARTFIPGLPVLLVSGDSDPEGLPPGLHCLAKPFRMVQLEARLAQLGPLDVAGND